MYLRTLNVTWGLADLNSALYSFVVIYTAVHLLTLQRPCIDSVTTTAAVTDVRATFGVVWVFSHFIHSEFLCLTAWRTVDVVRNLLSASSVDRTQCTLSSVRHPPFGQLG